VAAKCPSWHALRPLVRSGWDGRESAISVKGANQNHRDLPELWSRRAMAAEPASPLLLAHMPPCRPRRAARHGLPHPGRRARRCSV